jgi:RES domain-containing protein
VAIVWRLTPPPFAFILNGEGNRSFGARWNSPGRGVVYTCEHLSLSVLETYVHIPPEQRDSLPEFEAVRITFPDDAGTTTVSIPHLAKLLSSDDPQAACREIGDRWLASGADLVLVAPSVVVSEESNFMLNPAHPRMQEVAILSTRRFRFDPRLASIRRSPRHRPPPLT